MALQSEGETVQGRVIEQEIVNTDAPKSVARNAGDWEVRVTGKTELTYRIPNPFLEPEIENPEDPRESFSRVPTDNLEWTLVVPLYQGKEDLGAEKIEVVDTITRATVFNVDVEERKP